MSHILQASAVSVLTTALTTSTYILEHLHLKDLLDLHSSSASVSPLTKYPTPFFVRQDRKDKQKKVKVFGANGVQVYSIERLSAMNPVWTMLTYPQRQEIATIHVGLTSRSVDFHNKPGLSHRDVNLELGWGGIYRSFYLTDGTKYSWSKGSKYLEKVFNPTGGVEEIRERIAKVKLMRQFKLDFEVLVDTSKIDEEIALSTAFISMLTQWGVGEATDTIGPTYIEPRPISIEEDKDDANDDTENNVILVIENNGDSEYTLENVEN